LKLQITIPTDKSVLELKQAIATKSDVAADRQRLIYSGRVLKDDDILSVYKIQSSHTIHMVKGVSKSSAAPSSSGSPSTPQQLPTMQTGQNVHDPLTQLNSHLGFGAMAGLNPFGDMGLNPNDPNMMQGMLNSPQFMQQMSTMLSNPAVMDQIIAMDPRLAAMGPQVRAAFQDERFRQMISNPETLQQVLQMSNMLRDAGLGGGGGGFGMPLGNSSFPAPGSPSTNAPTGLSTTSPSSASPTSINPNTTGTTPLNPFALLGGFPVPAPGAAGATTGTPVANSTPGFGFDPALMQQMLGMGALGGPGAGGLGSYGSLGGSLPPSDIRPPEERFQVQLQQLQDMGFTNASQNVRALLATGGNVNSAIEYIFGGGGL